MIAAHLSEVRDAYSGNIALDLDVLVALSVLGARIHCNPPTEIGSKLANMDTGQCIGVKNGSNIDRCLW